MQTLCTDFYCFNSGLMVLCSYVFLYCSLFPSLLFLSQCFFTTTVKQISPQWDNKSSECESKRSKRKELTVMHHQTRWALGVAAGASLILGVVSGLKPCTRGGSKNRALSHLVSPLTFIRCVCCFRHSLHVLANQPALAALSSVPLILS